MTRIAVFLCLAARLWPQSPFMFREISPASLELAENGRPVLVYNFGMMRPPGVPEDRSRSSYLHPLYAPDGMVVTDDFPRDHYHHRGLSWMWPVVRIEGTQYDLWDLRGIRTQFVRWLAREVRPGQARLGVENGWYVGDRKVLKETVEIVARPAQAGRRRLDLTLSFEALERSIEIAGAPDQQKGYGGLSLRFAPRHETVIRTEAGSVERDSNMVPHAWAELEGTFQGGWAGARIDIDPANPGFPNGWCLRPYGFLGVNFPGLKAYTLVPGRPLVLKYRVAVFSKRAGQ
jgi:hypothetical protein